MEAVVQCEAAGNDAKRRLEAADGGGARMHGGRVVARWNGQTKWKPALPLRRRAMVQPELRDD